MKFSKLAHLFSELESTTKRLEMIDMLSIFFRHAGLGQIFGHGLVIIYPQKGHFLNSSLSMNDISPTYMLMILYG